MLFVKFFLRIGYDDARLALAFPQNRYILIDEARRFTATRRTDDERVQLTCRYHFNVSALFLRADDDSVLLAVRCFIVVHLKFF